MKWGRRGKRLSKDKVMDCEKVLYRVVNDCCSLLQMPNTQSVDVDMTRASFLLFFTGMQQRA